MLCLINRYGRLVITTRGEAWWHRWQIGICANLQNEIHADRYVEEEVTVEEPETYKV